jgi:hypothetical protein
VVGRAAVSLVLLAAVTPPATAQTGLPGGRAIAVSTSITPDVHLFAEPVTARTRVIVDPQEFNPDRIDVRMSFAPYQLVAAASRSERNVGNLVELEYTARLRCLRVACLAPRNATVLGEQEGGRPQRYAFRFPPAEVLHERPDGRVELILQRPFPAIEAVSRINAAQLDAADPLGDQLGEGSTSTYKASLEPPAPTYRASPRALAGGAFLLAGLLLLFPICLLGRFLLARWRARRRPRRLSPLERALVLVEWSGRQADGEQDQRRALEALADVLEDGGAEPLAETTRTLAWAEEAPDKRRADELAGEARSLLGGGNGRRT